MDKVRRQKELEDRLLNFAAGIITLINKLPKTASNRVIGVQVIKSSSSIGANYFEATCAYSKKDFVHDNNRVRKEAKESVFWLRLLIKTNSNFYYHLIENELHEAEGVFKIFNSIIMSSRKNI